MHPISLVQEHNKEAYKDIQKCHQTKEFIKKNGEFTTKKMKYNREEGFLNPHFLVINSIKTKEKIFRSSNDYLSSCIGFKKPWSANITNRVM